MKESTLNGDENNNRLRMRCHTCDQVSSWISIDDSCLTCIKNLNHFKNENQDLMVNLNNYDENYPKNIFN